MLSLKGCVAVAALGLAGVFAVWIGASGAAPGEGDAAHTGKAGAEAARVARDMLATLSQGRFVGTIDFEYQSSTRSDGATDETIDQLGRLYAGPSGEVRLDLWLEGGLGEPIVCCVTEGEAWMVWTTSSLVYRSAYPIQARHSGWLGQLRQQSQQTLNWASLLLYSHLRTGAQKPLEQAALVDGRLILRLGTAPAGDRIGPVEMEAALIPELSGYYPAQIRRTTTGSVLVLDGYELITGKTVLPRHIRQECVNGRGNPVWRSWSLTGIQAHDPSDTAVFERWFDAPSQRDERYPPLVGTCMYDTGGIASIAVWE